VRHRFRLASGAGASCAATRCCCAARHLRITVVAIDAAANRTVQTLLVA
jgi:hypothetical protein